jgi:hypothetical protein
MLFVRASADNPHAFCFLVAVSDILAGGVKIVYNKLWCVDDLVDWERILKRPLRESTDEISNNKQLGCEYIAQVERDSVYFWIELQQERGVIKLVFITSNRRVFSLTKRHLN